MVKSYFANISKWENSLFVTTPKNGRYTKNTLIIVIDPYKQSICQFDDTGKITWVSNPGCSIRVETLGNFEGKSRLPRQN